MRKLPVAAFAALAVATVGAFFLTQHLKVKNPLINGEPHPDPPAINPIDGHICRDIAGKRVSFKRTNLDFYLQSRSDTVGVYVVNAFDQIVDTITTNRAMHVNRRSNFVWDGRENDEGDRVAPEGDYHFRVALQSEGRTIDIATPVQVITTPPHPRVTMVRVTGSSTTSTQSGPAILSPTHGGTVTIHFTPGAYREAHVEIYRTDLPGRPAVVFRFGVNGRLGEALWNGRIHGIPAPAGTYLVGLSVVDAACNPGTFPVVDPPAPGTTPHAGVTIRYLAVEPPVTPTDAGTFTTVYVDSRLQPYTWALRAAGARTVIYHGSITVAQAAAGQGVALRVELPPDGAGLYELAVRSGSHRTVVPLVANATGRRAAEPVLVVLPALTWQGQNPVDDTGDGLPDTLTAGDRIDLARPLEYLPSDYLDELGVLAYLARRHLAYQLTTDVALAEGVGPSLQGHHGVLLDGSLAWLPSSLAATLRVFVSDGGRLMSVGVPSLQSEAPLQTTDGVQTAGPPSPLSTDPFGATHGQVVSTDHDLLTVITDKLGIFGTTLAFAGYGTYQTITPPNGTPTSLAGVADGNPTITGFRVERGMVVEVGLPGFGLSLAHNVDAQELVSQVWHLLST